MSGRSESWEVSWGRSEAGNWGDKEGGTFCCSLKHLPERDEDEARTTEGVSYLLKQQQKKTGQITTPHLLTCLLLQTPCILSTELFPLHLKIPIDKFVSLHLRSFDILLALCSKPVS
eukprot:768087-Hanusia_phi.AAC.4